MPNNSVKIEYGGGTNASNAPPIDYLINVFKPIIKRFGVDFEIDIERRGFYPQGNGIAHLIVPSIQNVKSIELVDRGQIETIHITSYSSGAVPISVAERMTKSCIYLIQKTFGENINIVQENIFFDRNQAWGTGTGINLYAITSTGCYLGGGCLGEKGVSAEKIGHRGAQSLINNIFSGGCVDEYLQDQLIIFMALAQGRSVIRSGSLTEHTRTAIHISETCAGAQFNVEECEDGTFLISCEGIGYENPHIN
eukprot:TRINITY_DN5501_c0_g1_i2.p1 TRINITY_DN5501_c0_g1~~TRINITY_DN5501_c0_g1_i2.p1  ORF type:complete len:252 (-),score=50.85 TRINITY_DN5501_c0_g1_i2:124-879(-)